jgi:hypothetical protein
MSWHYQIRRRTFNGEPFFDVVEVFIDSTTVGWTEEGVAAAGDTQDGVIACLEMMLEDCRKYPMLIDELEAKQ